MGVPSALVTDINRALLVEWAVRQLGKAVLVAALAAVVLGFIAAMAGDSGLLWLPSIGAPIGFGLSLWTAKVPPRYADAEPQLETE